MVSSLKRLSRKPAAGILYGLVLWAAFVACAAEQQKEVLDVPVKEEIEPSTIRYPNESAPLAWAMRGLFEDFEEVRDALREGQRHLIDIEQHITWMEAQPTDPKVKTAAFEQYAQLYINQINRFNEETDATLLEGHYKAILETCLACHATYCPGPMKRIRLLELDA
ncbi:Cytochrome C' [Nitritalea halalkaliphila LW7]|uniref:Cytochrome C n=1 Tax=Nitritalea halalkaliphila LW7 TaxID=1189621 RepID=I5C894_9BACT|nr:cytochrome c' [Nitritalea halalkaliphila]EIM78046.1 Cytochrome C' [Nitritalea halalkaliphila LW7]